MLTSVTRKCMVVRLHKVFLCSSFVTGPVVIGRLKYLPFGGTAVLLRNYLANQCCQPVVINY